MIMAPRSKRWITCTSFCFSSLGLCISILYAVCSIFSHERSKFYQDRHRRHQELAIEYRYYSMDYPARMLLCDHVCLIHPLAEVLMLQLCHAFMFVENCFRAYVVRKTIELMQLCPAWNISIDITYFKILLYMVLKHITLEHLNASNDTMAILAQRSICKDLFVLS